MSEVKYEKIKVAASLVGGAALFISTINIGDSSAADNSTKIRGGLGLTLVSGSLLYTGARLFKITPKQSFLIASIGGILTTLYLMRRDFGIVKKEQLPTKGDKYNIK